MNVLDAFMRRSRAHGVPLEDVLFISLNTSGVRYDCGYHRMRTALHLENRGLFPEANDRGDTDYYFALPVNPASPFSITGNVLSYGGTSIATVSGTTEDVCDSHYPRRNGTSLNLNPNSRTSCRGCDFCYTAYQVPRDLRRLRTADDLRSFFDDWLVTYGKPDLSHLIQVSIVTGCYDSSEEVVSFLQTLRRVLTDYRFAGRIFYLGSQITTADYLRALAEVAPLGICYSLEVFERREILRSHKRHLTLAAARDSMEEALSLGYEVNFTYIVGMESLVIMDHHFSELVHHVNKFPTINTLQIHEGQPRSLADPSAQYLDYYLDARRRLEAIFRGSGLQPLVWEDYRSLWFLSFDGQPLRGIRTP